MLDKIQARLKARSNLGLTGNGMTMLTERETELVGGGHVTQYRQCTYSRSPVGGGHDKYSRPCAIDTGGGIDE